MSKLTLNHTTEAKQRLESLFEEAPILVEVRFPHCATAPDWHLIHVEEELEEVLARVAPGTELYLHRVWDLQNAKGPVCLCKGR